MAYLETVTDDLFRYLERKRMKNISKFKSTDIKTASQLWNCQKPN